MSTVPLQPDPEPQEGCLRSPGPGEPPPGNGGAQPAVYTASSYRGPIPPATEAENWSRLIPDAAERILHMAEIQLAHRQDLERMHLEHSIRVQLLEEEGRLKELELNHQQHLRVLDLQGHRDRQRNERMRLGQCFGLTLGAGALFVAGFLGVRGQPWVAAIMGTGGLAGIVWAAVSAGKKVMPSEQAFGPSPQDDKRGDLP